MRLITNEEVNEVSGGAGEPQIVTITGQKGTQPGLTDEEKKDIAAANGAGGGV